MIMAEAAQADSSGAWTTLASAVRLRQDPGAAVAFVEAVADAVARFGSLGHDVQGSAHRLQLVAAAVMASPSWRDGSWHRSANPSRRGGRHTGSVDDRPVLACLVADRRALAERATLDGLRLLLVLFLAAGNETSGAVVIVAEAVRKAEAMEAWRQVARAMPRPGDDNLDLPAWLQAIGAHLARAEPPTDLANVPAASIREFFHALQTLIRSVEPGAQRTRPQRDLFGDDDPSPRGVIRSIKPTPDGTARRAPWATSQADDLYLDRRQPEQEVLVFDDEDLADGPANVPLATTPAITPSEQPQVDRCERVDQRLASYRLLEMSQRLRWAWDHLNPLDCRVLVEAIRLDLNGDRPRWRGAVICLVMLGLGCSARDALKLVVGAEVAGSDWVDEHWRWRRQIRRPAKAWKPSASLGPQMATMTNEVVIDLPPLLQEALSTTCAAAGQAGRLSHLLGVAPDDAGELLSEWLAPIRRRNPSARLTPGRISRALSVELFAVAGQELVVHALTSTDESVPPVAAYYVALEDAKLAEACRKAWERLLGDGGPGEIRSTCLVGAPVLSTQAITTWAARLRADVVGAATLIDRHNAYCRYALSLVIAGTGLRPINDPLESTDMLDLTLGMAEAADKAAHRPGEARLIPLSPLVVCTLRHWLEHLSRLAKWVNSTQPTLSLQIETVIHPFGPRALPLFFMLDEDLQPQRIDRTTIESWWPAALEGLPANQLRRELATAAMRGDWPAELCQQLLGHVDLAQPTLGALSPLSPKELEKLQPAIDAMLLRQGWTELATPLGEGPTRRGRPLPRFAPAPAVLGSAQRSAQLAANDRRFAKHVEERLRAWCKGRNLRALHQDDIDALHRDALRGRASPGTPAELAGLRRIDRLLRWLKRRYGQTQLRLPASRTLTVLPVQHLQGDMLKFHLWQQMRGAFEGLLHQRARRSHGLTGAGQLAEAMVGAALYSFVADPRVLDALTRPGTWKLTAVDGLGAFLVVSQTWPCKEVAVQRFPMQPMSLLLLARVAEYAGHINQDGRSECRRSLQRLITTLRRQVEGGTATDFAGPDAALRWLCSMVGIAARTRLPGHVAAYLDGSTESVGLAEHDWSRWMTGKAPRIDAAPDAEAIAPTQPDRPAACIPASAASPTEAAGRAKGLALHRSVRAIFRQVSKAANEFAVRTQRSLNRNEVLIPQLEAALEQHAEAPDFVLAMVQWLIELLQNSSDDRILQSVSADRYFTELIRLVIDTLSAHTLADIDEDALASAFSELLERIGAGRLPYTWGRLRDFHRFLIRHHCLPEIDWGEIAPEGLERHHAPDAGVMLWPEYTQALELLAADPTTDLRERSMQACVLILLYRFGLRVGECIALRAADLILFDEQWIVLVRRNAYRNLKSDAGVRQVPLIGPLSPLESKLLEGWQAHADATVGSDRCGVLIAQSNEPRRLADRKRLMDRITDALRVVAQRPTAHPHHLRHAYACRMALMLCMRELPSDPARLRLVRRLIGPCDPRAARQVLLDTDAPSKRGLWALALAIGHASPSTALRWYIHVHEYMLVVAMEDLGRELEVKLDATTAAYACGRPVARSRHRIVMDAAWAERHLVAGALQPVATCKAASSQPVLPARKPATTVSLDLLTVDRLLEQVHRRSRVDAMLAQRLMLDPAVITDLLRHEFACREAAGYDLSASGWHPTSSREALNHVRAGSRRPVETERVRGFMRQLAAIAQDADWRGQTKRAVDAWTQRYRATSTPILVASAQEASALVNWCRASGVRTEDLLILMPSDGGVPQDLGEIDSSVERVEAPLGSARVQYRNQGRVRLGIQLRENDVGPMTQMTQVHRVMHVLATWLAATERTIGETT
ncbi:site-specific recombinase XerD [Burkholderiales bacterium JOSHI_001]|nr:site-specific recombinase XerD [Burkholderiales bacterium JOSHI_001]